ncbi:MAG: nitroreductase family protein [Myxococcales bacterium]|nr:nitroreductase family protein [Myxococcales bacterium]
MIEVSEQLADELSLRRSVREFSPEPVPMAVIENAIRTAGQAPSGANKQPWTFAVVTDPDIKRRIRRAAELEEQRFYEERAPQSWLDDLAPLGTDANKPFLEDAPTLIVIFAQTQDEKGGKHYYVKESVGIATGFLLLALHHAGLVSLTHTPSPMGFLSEVLDRPANERAYMLIPVGYPAVECTVPKLTRKPLSDILVRY